ncbi:hypothetical protein LAM21_23500, partial [Mycobacterium tuberculosis]|nr:hypothetical protein [Mycobacterium tuberculosis]
VKAAEQKGLVLSEPTNVDQPVGKGITGTVDGRAVVVGKAGFFDELGVPTGMLAARADELRADGATAIFLGIDGVTAGVIAIADPVK